MFLHDSNITDLVGLPHRLQKGHGFVFKGPRSFPRKVQTDAWTQDTFPSDFCTDFEDFVVVDGSLLESQSSRSRRMLLEYPNIVTSLIFHLWILQSLIHTSGWVRVARRTRHIERRRSLLGSHRAFQSRPFGSRRCTCAKQLQLNRSRFSKEAHLKFISSFAKSSVGTCPF